VVAVARFRPTLTGHTDPVDAVAISPDGTWLATASRDGTARIWASAADGANAHSVTAIRVDGTVSACARLPGGSQLCIAGARGIYRFSLHPPGG
jgi:WD40 repeat protein